MKRDADLTYEIDANESPTEAIVYAVASFTDTPILDLDPLYDVINPDQVDAMLETPEENGIKERTIQFHFNGCQVTVTQEKVHVRNPESDVD